MANKSSGIDAGTSWAITAAIGLTCLRIVLYCFKPEEMTVMPGRAMAQMHTNDNVRRTVLRDDALETVYQFDRRVSQVEASHNLQDWDDETMFLRFEHGNNDQGRTGFYAMKQGDRYTRRNTEDASFEEVLYEGSTLYYGDEAHDIDQVFVSPDLKWLLLLTEEGERTCGNYWVWNVASKEMRNLGNERLCDPHWSEHSTAVRFSSVEISPVDAYLYHTQSDQLVHQHNVIRPHAIAF